MSNLTDIAETYARGNIKETIFEALKEAGKNPDQLDFNDMKAFAELHLGGRQATQSLADQLGLGPDSRLLDVGSGLGGPAQFIAGNYNCRVTGIDATEEFCNVARELAGSTGLDRLVSFTHGDATDMPWEENTFTHALMEHVSMNIENKERLFAELFRVLEPGGKFALYDIVAGPKKQLIFPLPWARKSSNNHLISQNEMRSLAQKASFQIKSWQDKTAEMANWLNDQIQKTKQQGPPIIGIHLALGPNTPELLVNLAKNFEQQKLEVAEAVLLKQPD